MTDRVSNRIRGGSAGRSAADEAWLKKLLDSEMWSGYLMVYCESQFSAESLNFLLAVRKLRQKVPPSAWPVPWFSIDEKVFSNKFLESVSWPSEEISREKLLQEVKDIWEQYIEEEAPDSIFLPSDVVQRTLKRIEHIELYGPDVFGEACIDPIKTLKKDILPRFQSSFLYLEMEESIRAGVTKFTRKVEKQEEAISNEQNVVVIDSHTPKRNIFYVIVLNIFVMYPRMLFLRFLAYFARPPMKENPKLLKSLLSRQWSYAVPATVALNLFLYMILGLEHYLSSDPVCQDKHVFPYWVWLIDYTISGGFAMSIFLNLNRMANSTGQLSNELYAALAGNIGISIQAGTAMILTTATNYGGTCRDMFGVVTPSTQWPEWLTTVPFLIYTAVAVEDKPKLNSEDIGVIVSMFFCILTGYFLNLELPWWLAYILLIVSCLSMLSTVYMVVRANNKHASVVNDDNASALTKAAFIAVAEQSRILSVLCLVAMPILPLLYFMAVGGALSINTFYACNNIVSCLVKLVFAAIAAEGHMATTEQMFSALETDVEVAREGEAFAEHLFQRVTIPLKSVVAGLELLTDSVGDKDAQVAANMKSLRDTTLYINQNLNELLSADRTKIRKEDALRLLPNPFVLGDLLKRVVVSFQKKMISKLVNCKMELKPEVPKMMVGDVVRLEHVLSVLFESALEACPSKGRMGLGIAARPFVQNAVVEDKDEVRPFGGEEEKKDEAKAANKKQLCLLCFEVTRTAAVTIAEETSFLSAPRKKKEEEGEARHNTVIDKHKELSIAREIVVLHGGSVLSSSSSNGKSSTVGFSIPYEMSNGSVEGLSDV